MKAVRGMAAAQAMLLRGASGPAGPAAGRATDDDHPHDHDDDHKPAGDNDHDLHHDDHGATAVEPRPLRR